MSFFDDASLVFLPSGEAGKDGKAYSIKPTDGSGDFTFSRGNNLSATRVDSNGLIEKGRENLLLQSNQFDTTWSDELLGSIVSGQSGYDGTNDAWLLNKGEYQYRRVLQTLSPSVSGIWTLSVYAKEGTTSIMNLRDMTNSYRVEFDLSGSGSVSAAFGNISSKIESVGNGWFRCSATFNGTSSSVGIYVGWNDSTASNIYIQDAQLEIGLTATEPIESGATTGKAGILEDSPRFDYSGGASCPSLLLEPSRSNLIISEYLPLMSQIGSPVFTANATTSPEGYQNMAEFSSSATSDRYQKNLGVLSGQHIFSAFFKYAGTEKSVYIRMSDTSSRLKIDIASSGVTIDAAGSSNIDDSDVIDYGNGIYRCYMIFTPSTGTTFAQFYPSATDTTGSVYAYGFQLEQGSYPTSYMPNHSGGSVTRAADSSTLSSIINGDAAFTFMIESGVQDYGSSVPKYFDAGALGYINHNTSNTLRYRLGGSNYVQSISGLDSFKFLLRYDRSEIKVYFNGSLEHTISASLSGSIGLSLLGGLNKQVLLFPTDLPDNQCITLTS